MKKAILVLSTILFAGVAHAGPFGTVYTMVQKSLAKTTTLRAVEREVTVMVEAEQMATRIPAHEFTLANGLIVQLEDPGKIMKASTYLPIEHAMNPPKSMDLVVIVPLKKIPKSKEALAEMNKKFKALDDEVNGIRGLTRNGPAGFYSSIAESSRRITVTADIDAGKLDELLEATLTKLGAIAL